MSLESGSGVKTIKILDTDALSRVYLFSGTSIVFLSRLSMRVDRVAEEKFVRLTIVTEFQKFVIQLEGEKASMFSNKS